MKYAAVGGARVSPGSGARNVCRIDLIENLEKATVPNDDHLLINHTDGPAARQIKDLKAEILLLNKNLKEKALEMHPGHGMASSPSWKDKLFQIHLSLICLRVC